MKEKNNKNKYSTLIRRIVLAILGILLGVNVYLANARSVVGNRLPMPFGIGAAVVLSGSMEDALSVNDVIIVRESEEYNVRDIVVYDDGRDLIVHRIVEKDGDMITTQGDANPTPDDSINIKSVKGKVVFSVPYLGVVINALRSPVGAIIIILAAILLTECSFRRKKESDEERLKKIKEEIRKLKEEQDNKPE